MIPAPVFCILMTALARRPGIRFTSMPQVNVKQPVLDRKIAWHDFSAKNFKDESIRVGICLGTKGLMSAVAFYYALSIHDATGIPVAIVGKPNVGKSTLLNTILQHDRAIVSHIPGTTRDTIEDTFNINGTLFRFIDTAGIRQSDDEIENYGIQRTYHAIEQAAIILYMLDITQDHPDTVEQEIEDFKAHVDMQDKQLVIIANKIDQMESLPADYQRWHDMGILFTSAKRNVNIDSIEEQLTQYVERFQIQDLSLLTNERHYALLSDISTSIDRIQQGLDDQIPTDLLAEDVRAALYDLGCLTGTISTDELLGNIFGKFCIGK